MIIVDTSVAMKWLNKAEAYQEAAFTLYKNHIEQKEQILIVGLFYIEAANALATKGDLSQTEIREGLDFLYDANFVYHSVTRENITDAAILAKKYNTSVYDMLYVVIAEVYKVLLITADEKFAAKVNLPFVQRLSSLK